METTSLLKANSSLLSKRRHNFHEYLCCSRSVIFTPSFRFAIKYDKLAASSRCPKVESFMRSISNSTTKLNSAALTTTRGNSAEKSAINTVYETIKGLKIPALLMTQCFALVMMMYCRNSALARSIAEENVSVVTSATVCSQSTCSCEKNGVRENGGEIEFSESDWKIMICLSLITLLILLVEVDELNKFGVIKVQLTLVDVDLRGGLYFTALKADTSSSEGLGETLGRISQLIRAKFGWEAGYSSMKMFNDKEEAEKYFKHLLTNERGKFDEQLLYLDDVEKESIRAWWRGGDYRIKTSVVTILVIAKGKGVRHFPNNITYMKELRHALRQLENMCQFGQADIYAVNILWTPQPAEKLLSMKEILQEYPLLKRLNPAL